MPSDSISDSRQQFSAPHSSLPSWAGFITRLAVVPDWI